MPKPSKKNVSDLHWSRSSYSFFLRPPLPLTRNQVKLSLRVYRTLHLEQETLPDHIFCCSTSSTSFRPLFPHSLPLPFALPSTSQHHMGRCQQRHRKRNLIYTGGSESLPLWQEHVVEDEPRAPVAFGRTGTHSESCRASNP